MVLSLDLFSTLDSVRKITRKLKEIDVDEIVQARKRQKHSHRFVIYHIAYITTLPLVVYTN